MTDFLKEVGTTEVTQILGEMEIIIQTKSKILAIPDGETWKTNFKNYIAQPKFKILIKMKPINKLDNLERSIKGNQTP